MNQQGKLLVILLIIITTAPLMDMSYLILPAPHLSQNILLAQMLKVHMILLHLRPKAHIH